MTDNSGKHIPHQESDSREAVRKSGPSRLRSIFRLFPGGRKELISGNVEIADNFVKRFFGLMGRKTLDPRDGLFLMPCPSIHTYFMRFPIDVVALDKENRITAVMPAMPPNRTFMPRKGTFSMLEFKPGFIEKFDLKPGDLLTQEAGSGSDG